ncbi:TadE/TadG family type IV pilus assembly protein [Allobranchiibius sp. GilTou73]|uniref:TadE/TadG family type IV pilus assembly protein n=1 Tax=Allobranchiibius sp. GilTou73 TaxID=2904523 RepID=UPI001F3BDE7A|nr:TadE family protein [Allobranchiibius sp. GilTou73]UIJ34300.1 pilus assembly protein [Allobranchiibius sp. GilTou73]
MSGRKHGLRDRGAAAVEFALVAPLLILLVMGIMEFGRAYEAQTTLSGAARASVRVMALSNDPVAARTAAKNVASPSITLSDAQIAISPASCATSGTTAPATATVTITYPLSFFTNLFGSGVTLTGKGSMRCNG